MNQTKDAPSRQTLSADKDKVSSYGWKALIGSAVGYAMDGFDLLILGFMLSAISADLQLSATQAGSLVTWTLVGAVAGGLIFGALSDIYGRIRVLTWTIVLFAVFTGLCAVAQGYWDLLIYRTIAGIGLGGEFGIGMALAAEAWPANLRARATSYVALGWQLGVLGAALVTPALLPHIGWRGMFMVGVVPALVAWAICTSRRFSSKAPSNARRWANPSACCSKIRQPPRSALASSCSARCRTSATTA